jgi:hypothetical protein
MAPSHLSTGFELLWISDGRDYRACRNRSKARDTLQAAACFVGPMPCQQFYFDFLDLFGDVAQLRRQNAEHFHRKRRQALISCRFKKSKQPFDIADASSNYNTEFGEMGANGADKSAPLTNQ